MFSTSPLQHIARCVQQLHSPSLPFTPVYSLTPVSLLRDVTGFTRSLHWEQVTRKEQLHETGLHARRSGLPRRKSECDSEGRMSTSTHASGRVGAGLRDVRDECIGDVTLAASVVTGDPPPCPPCAVERDGRTYVANFRGTCPARSSPYPPIPPDISRRRNTPSPIYPRGRS